VGADALGEAREVARVERLRAVAERSVGVLVDLDDDAVRPDRGGRPGQRLDQAAVARRVAGVDDHRQVRVQLQPRDRREVEREARGRLERADAALAQHHLVVALLEHVVRGHQQLVERRGEPALEQHRLADLACRLEQRVVLHVAGADLHDVGVLGDRVGVVGVQELGDDRQAGLGPRLGEDLQRRNAQALERERRRARLERPAAEHARPGRRHRVGDRERLLARLDRARPGDQAERLLAADLPPVNAEHRGLVVRELVRGELVRARDRHHPVHTRHSLQPELADALRIPDRADRRGQLAR